MICVDECSARRRAHFADEIRQRFLIAAEYRLQRFPVFEPIKNIPIFAVMFWTSVALGVCISAERHIIQLMRRHVSPCRVIQNVVINGAIDVLTHQRAESVLSAVFLIGLSSIVRVFIDSQTYRPEEFFGFFIGEGCVVWECGEFRSPRITLYVSITIGYEIAKCLIR